MYLQKNTVYRTPPINAQLALQAHSDLRKASGFVITTEPLGFVLTKQVNDILLRVYLLAEKNCLDHKETMRYTNNYTLKQIDTSCPF